jgi:hypothetical protein
MNPVYLSSFTGPIREPGKKILARAVLWVGRKVFRRKEPVFRRQHFSSD